jgi:hypothetical protein
MFLDIIQRPVLSKDTVLFIFQNNISETGLYLRLQVKHTQLGMQSPKRVLKYNKGGVLRYKQGDG